MKSLIFFALLLGLGTATNAPAQDIRAQLQKVAQDLTKRLEDKGKKRVIISSFLSLDNRETQLGRYMADKFSLSIGNLATSLEVTDRSQLAELLQANKLAAERILNPQTIPGLAKMTGADVVITGNYAPLDNNIDITLKAIDIERGIRLAVAEVSIPRTPEINKLLEDVISDPGSPGPDPKPDPNKRCAANHTGTYCFLNSTKSSIRIGLGSAGNFTILPGKTECNYGMSAGSSGEKGYKLYVYRDPKSTSYETRQIVVTECQVKTYEVR